MQCKTVELKDKTVVIRKLRLIKGGSLPYGRESGNLGLPWCYAAEYNMVQPRKSERIGGAVSSMSAALENKGVASFGSGAGAFGIMCWHNHPLSSRFRLSSVVSTATRILCGSTRPPLFPRGAAQTL